MTYKVYSEDSYGLKELVFTTDSYSKAYHFCKRRNTETERYLQDCEENREQVGNTEYYWFEKEESKDGEIEPTDEVGPATSFTRTYYTIYKEYENGIRQFLCIVESEWVAKDFCKRYDHLVYEKVEVKETESL